MDQKEEVPDDFILELRWRVASYLFFHCIIQKDQPDIWLYRQAHITVVVTRQYNIYSSILHILF